MNTHLTHRLTRITGFVLLSASSVLSQPAEPAHPAGAIQGSSAAQESYFDRDLSDFKPSHTITAPGKLKGHWLKSDQESALQISPDPSSKAADGEVFLMQAGAARWLLEPAYGRFAAYGCDVDGDQIDEVVIEDGVGRGTCVYRRRLTILKMFDGAWQSVLSTWLSGYLPDAQQGYPLQWQRKYRLESVRSGGFDVALQLVPPKQVPSYLGGAEDYDVLQHPHCAFRYQPDAKAFRTWNETFVRLPATNGRMVSKPADKSVKLPVPFVAKGHIWVTNSAGKAVQLTFSRRDRAPKVSPDGRYIAFIRKATNHVYLAVGSEEDCTGDSIFADQVWVVDLGSGKERLLACDRAPGQGDATKELQHTIASIDDDSLCFSPDGSDLYFITSAWATSGALHAVNLRTGREQFIRDANAVEVVQSGEYAGHLIVNQHRYFLGSGSFDWCWLLDPEGRDVGPVGEPGRQLESFKQLQR